MTACHQYSTPINRSYIFIYS